MNSSVNSAKLTTLQCLPYFVCVGFLICFSTLRRWIYPDSKLSLLVRKCYFGNRWFQIVTFSRKLPIWVIPKIARPWVGHGVWYDQEFSNCTVSDPLFSGIIRRWRQPGGRKTFSAFWTLSIKINTEWKLFNPSPNRKHIRKGYKIAHIFISV